MLLFQIFAIITLLCIIICAALMSLFDWRKCCEAKSGCCDRKSLYYRLILEEEDNVLEEILRKAAKERLTEEVMKKIRGKQWWSCFDVAEGLMKQPPVLTQQQETTASGATTTRATTQVCF